MIVTKGGKLVNFDSMDDYRKGLYTGLFEAWANENGLEKTGITRHRVPFALPTLTPPYEEPFDMERFLATEAEMDSEGGIFTVGFEASGNEAFVYLYCTEAEEADWYDYDRDGAPANAEGVLERYSEWRGSQR